MKRFAIFWLTAGLTLCLGACRREPMATPTPWRTEPPAAEVTPTPTPEPTPTDTDPEIYAEVPISLLDLSSYEGELPNEEWEALRGFFPVLNNEVPMLAAHLSSGEEGVTPTEEVFSRDIYEVYDPESGLPPSRYLAMSFSLTPVVGEEPDLILVMNSFNGWHLLIHREGERFYAVYMPFRWFGSLQTDGLFMGSGGAATAYYRRLHFSNGTFTEELLANTDWGEWNEDGSYSGYYAIGGTEVTEAEFDAWLEDVFFTEDAVWRPTRAKSLEPWQAAYIEILSGYDARRAEFAPDIQGIYEESYAIYDIDKNGLPELFLIEGFSEASRVCHVYFWQDGFAVEAKGHQEGYMEGSLDFWHGSLSTCPGENGVLWSQGRSCNKVRLIDGQLVGDSLNGTLSKDISTDEITADMFVPDAEGLCSYEPSDFQPILSYPAANVYGTNGETVELSQADFSVYLPVLLSEEQKALEDFLPVLTGKEPLIPDWNDGEKVLLTDWFKEMLSSESGDLPSVFTAFALCDLDGDGARELILWIDGYGGCYTILHREKGVLYGTYRSVRQFQELQTDGIYASTGGMGNRSYCRASFEDGKLLEKELGYTRYYGEDDLVHYFVGEKEVSEAEFETWLEEHLVGDAVWYAAREEKGEP